MTATKTKPTKRPAIGIDSEDASKFIETAVAAPPAPPSDTPPSAGTVEPPGKGWKLTWGDQSWTEDDLTAARATLVSALAGADTWSLLDPTSGPAALLAVLSAFVCTTEMRDPQDVVAELGALPVARLLEAVSIS